MPNRAFARITNVSIPQQSNVYGVFARMTAYSNLQGDTVNLRCAFVNADNPDAPLTYSALQSFNVTDWVEWNTLSAWVANEVYDTPDLSVILQQVIDREGWQSGNAVILIVENVSSTDQRSFISVRFDDHTKGVILFAQYEAIEGTGQFPAGESSLPDSTEWCFRGSSFPPIIEGMGSMQNNEYVFPALDISSPNKKSMLITNWYGNISQLMVDFDATDLPNNSRMECGLNFLVYGGGPYAETIDSQQEYLCNSSVWTGVENIYAHDSMNHAYGPNITLVRSGGDLNIEIIQKVGPYGEMYVGDGISGSYYASVDIAPFTGGLTGTIRIVYSVPTRAMVDDIWYPQHNEFRVYIDNSLVFHTRFTLNYLATSPTAEYGQGEYFIITDKHLYAYLGFNIGTATQGSKEVYGVFSDFTTVEDFREYTYWTRKNPVSYLDWGTVVPSGYTDGPPLEPLPPGVCIPPSVWNRVVQRCVVISGP